MKHPKLKTCIMKTKSFFFSSKKTLKLWDNFYKLNTNWAVCSNNNSKLLTFDRRISQINKINHQVRAPSKKVIRKDNIYSELKLAGFVHCENEQVRVQSHIKSANNNTWSKGNNSCTARPINLANKNCTQK